MWTGFTKEETDKMGTDKVALHFHDFVISMDTFNNCPKMVENMLITQTDTGIRTDTEDTITFVNAYEAKNYPVYTTMYHPEYQLSPGIEKAGGVRNDFTRMIATKLCE